jgi:hypothetical protein
MSGKVPQRKEGHHLPFPTAPIWRGNALIKGPERILYYGVNIAARHLLLFAEAILILGDKDCK